MYCLFCIVLCIVLCKCVLYFCHRVTTQLQLTNISYHIICLEAWRVSFHPTPGRTEIYTAQGRTPSIQFWLYQTTSKLWRWERSLSPKRLQTISWGSCLPEKISLNSDNFKLVNRRKLKPVPCPTSHYTHGGRVLEVSPWRMRDRSAEVTQICW